MVRGELHTMLTVQQTGIPVAPHSADVDERLIASGRRRGAGVWRLMIRSQFISEGRAVNGAGSIQLDPPGRSRGP